VNERGQGSPEASTPPEPQSPSDAGLPLDRANEWFERGEYSAAIDAYRGVIERMPLHAGAWNNLGAAHCKLGLYVDAEAHFRRAIEIARDYETPHINLGNLLRWKGRLAEAQLVLNCALALNPNSLDARISLGFTAVLLGRLRDARSHFERALSASPGCADALLGMGQIARLEGRFDEAEAQFRSALESRPSMPMAWAALAGVRKMTRADNAWLMGAQEIVASGISPNEEADLRFAIGKYCDDIGDYDQAFENYERGNMLLKEMAGDYDRAERSAFVDDVIRENTRHELSRTEPGSSPSTVPVFVVGMMRSGTSLAEQIIASHPLARGAGELPFWKEAALVHSGSIRRGMFGESQRKALAEAYLALIGANTGKILRVVDKTTFNLDHLGLIHSVFPNARIIFMQRDPADTCLSCYFQQFFASLNFTMDLSDLAHYYREHLRLIAHWREVLPPTNLLTVSYSDLVSEPEQTMRRMLDFVGLEWNRSCLDFHQTQRTVLTASAWQVRQKLHTDSLGRAARYEKFLGPLRSLAELEPADSKTRFSMGKLTPFMRLVRGFRAGRSPGSRSESG